MKKSKKQNTNWLSPLWKFTHSCLKCLANSYTWCNKWIMLHTLNCSLYWLYYWNRWLIKHHI